MKEEFVFDNLIKLSQNEALAMHWGKRKKIREFYEDVITHLVRKRFGGKQFYVKNADVTYEFRFIQKPLDCLNCAEMVKIIEDIIFLKDDPDHVRSLKIISKEDTSIKDKMIVLVTIEWEDAAH